MVKLGGEMIPRRKVLMGAALAVPLVSPLGVEAAAHKPLVVMVSFAG